MDSLKSKKEANLFLNIDSSVNSMNLNIQLVSNDIYFSSGYNKIMKRLDSINNMLHNNDYVVFILEMKVII